MTSFHEATVLERLARDEHGALASAVLALRPKQIDLMERAYRSLFTHFEPGGLSPAACAFFAAHAASNVGETTLAAHYSDLAHRHDQTPGSTRLDASSLDRRTLLLRHLDRITVRPSAVTQQNIAELVTAGLTAIEIVTIAQIAAFVSYQARVLAGLRIFASPARQATSTLTHEESAPATDRNFTLETLRWQPWLEPVAFASATPEQRDALAECGVPARDSAYFRLLAHAPSSLRARTRLYNAILFDSGGLSRAEREFATVTVSRANGCVYCASVHARRFAELTKATAPIQAFLQQDDTTALSPRLQAIWNFAHRLTQAPHDLDRNDLARLEEAGFVQLEILDLIQSSALFAWANRLMLTLGEPERTSGDSFHAQ